ncbi:hypothetical protein M422DRAFT_269737 [Sphaerobolus stellatus SS14]|uniref:Protein kinase domain-containing protein n=1 Tax=Sphaerobolus stellatus (strain SS14) TaxID=990650 RepID=A0A0C9UJ82_SPHS4|nr:hypothetical protein M422DRAFT_269737 [Sphaerobolus stellatus SS14]
MPREDEHIIQTSYIWKEPEEIDAMYKVSGYIMKYMPGGDLWSLYSKHLLDNYAEPLTHGVHPSVVRFYVVDILQKLRQIHSMGYYHGDVKMQNLMMTEEGRVLFTDFGSAGRDRWSERLHHPEGTVMVMAPEFFLWDNQSGYMMPGDLWAVGILAYMLVFFDHPYENEAEEEPSDENVYPKLMQFVQSPEWPVIDEDDPLCKEKEEALDFIQDLLVYNQEERLSWHHISYHPWIKEQWYAMKYHEVEPEAPLIYRDDKWVIAKSWENYLV